MQADDKPIRCCIRPKEDSPIFTKKLLDLSDMPDGFYEVYGLIRNDMDNDAEYLVGTLREVVAITQMVGTLSLCAAQGMPVLWIASKKHTQFHKAVFSRMKDVVFKILRGSLRNDNPYTPLVMDSGETGGSNDEHVVMLSAAHKMEMER